MPKTKERPADKSARKAPVVVKPTAKATPVAKGKPAAKPPVVAKFPAPSLSLIHI